MTINYNQLFELTSQLIKYESISPQDMGCMEFIQQYLTNIGFKCMRLDSNHTSNLIARFGDNDNIFAFAGHIDVVPPGDYNLWSFDPFTLTKSNQYLYGRGIADMKGSVAAMLSAINTFCNQPHHNASIMVILTSDEEGEAKYGTKIIVEHLLQHNIKIQHCILGEPSSKSVLGDTIKIGRRGSLTGTIKIIGKQGHVAYPENCINPIDQFVDIVSKIRNLRLDRISDRFPNTSLQFVNLHSGLGVSNVTPIDLITEFNIRYNDAFTAKELQQMITNEVSKITDHFEIDWRHSAECFLTESTELSQLIIDVVSDYTNGSVVPLATTTGGTSDARFLIKSCKNLVEFGLCGSSIHQINEHILESDLYVLAEMYLLILNRIFCEQTPH
jgi:succinyl-diaminopimelate desuccinylase